MEAASCGARQDAGPGSIEEGQSSVGVRSSERKYPFLYHERKTIVFMVGIKDSNSTANTREMAGGEGRYGRKKGDVLKIIPPAIMEGSQRLGRPCTVTVDRRVAPPTAAPERGVRVSLHPAPQCSDTLSRIPTGRCSPCSRVFASWQCPCKAWRLT
jgi:hypothetical protein